MKFFSKNANLGITLKVGQPAEPLTGRVAVPGKYIRFEQGVVDIKDEETIAEMQRHAGYKVDFIMDESGETPDPYSNFRRDTEPQHDVQEIVHGSVGKNLNPKPALKLTPEQKNSVTEMAKMMAKDMVKEILAEQAEQNKSATKKKTTRKYTKKSKSNKDEISSESEEKTPNEENSSQDEN